MEVEEIAKGVTMAEATEDDFAELNADMREKDRAELAVFGLHDEDRKNWDAAFAVRIDGDLVCIIGWGHFRDQTFFSRFCCVMAMSTNKVWKHRVGYVKHSRAMLCALVKKMPSWVTDLYSIPMKDYTESIRWQERAMGFTRVEDIKINGVWHTVLHAKTRR